jgi:hypothetical protein
MMILEDADRLQEYVEFFNYQKGVWPIK